MPAAVLLSHGLELQLDQACYLTAVTVMLSIVKLSSVLSPHLHVKPAKVNDVIPVVIDALILARSLPTSLESQSSVPPSRRDRVSFHGCKTVGL